jgi:hypothetical protein
MGQQFPRFEPGAPSKTDSPRSSWAGLFFRSVMIHPDQISDKLKELGVTIEDSKDGTKWRYS